MNSALASIVRNECDIIESFVRYHANLFDHIFILDHLSKDGTSEILNSLVEEGLPLTVKNIDVPFHHQGESITSCLKEIRKTYKPNLMMALDADEFLVGDIRSALYSLPKNQPCVCTAYWWNYAPTNLHNPNPLKTICYRNTNINLNQHKVLVPGSLFDFDVHFKEGCHELYYEQDKIIYMKECQDIHIAHMPIRSINQFKKKAVVNWISKLANPSNRGVRPEWSHWKLFFDRVKKNDEISLAELQNLALGYSFDQLHFDYEMKYDPIRTDIDIKYSIDDNYESFQALSDAAEILAYHYGLVADRKESSS